MIEIILIQYFSNINIAQLVYPHMQRDWLKNIDAFINFHSFIYCCQQYVSHVPVLWLHHSTIREDEKLLKQDTHWENVCTDESWFSFRVVFPAATDS